MSLLFKCNHCGHNWYSWKSNDRDVKNRCIPCIYCRQTDQVEHIVVPFSERVQSQEELLEAFVVLATKALRSVRAQDKDMELNAEEALGAFEHLKWGDPKPHGHSDKP